jgi:hypothetical protein
MTLNQTLSKIQDLAITIIKQYHMIDIITIYRHEWIIYPYCLDSVWNNI